MNVMSKRGLRQYGKVAVGSEVDYASPHRLIQMLMEGALEKIVTAKGCMIRRDIEAKGRHVSWAISIVGGLQNSLDLEAGGEIAQNLDDLYAYVCRRLMDANLNNDPDILDEVTSLLLEIKGAWDAMPDTVKKTAQVKAAAGAKL